MRTAFLLLVLAAYSFSVPLKKAAETDEEYLNVGSLRYLRQPLAQQATDELLTYAYPSPRLEYYNLYDFTSLGTVPINNPILNPFYNPYDPQVYTNYPQNYPLFNQGQASPLIITLRNLP
ncbi:hypothetical protein AMEX_G23489 [Astyanax mexicanus]|uniref:Uncharacterized protein n=1 Tax=Astyanax mexicanus TaxID=7994 RepID=A0A8T2L0M6_ASTMX|nr:hypothetical protein AMEX_G23489 [Astyanax mexicanus]